MPDLPPKGLGSSFRQLAVLQNLARRFWTMAAQCTDLGYRLENAKKVDLAYLLSQH